MKLAICIAVYGRLDLTEQILRQIDVSRGDLDIYLCDNAGDCKDVPVYVRLLRPGRNLGWLGGTNLCWRAARDSGVDYDGYVLMNNDVILSADFFSNLAAGLAEAGPDTAIVAPLYDDCCRFQFKVSYPASQHEPVKRESSVPYVDGTCMLVAKAAAEKLGYLDDEHFGFFGWGADIDYCIRARQAGFRILVTERAFLNHLGRATANAVFSDYKSRALRDYRLGMARKYGRFWGRYLEQGFLRRSVRALRSCVTTSRLFLQFAERAG